MRDAEEEAAEAKRALRIGQWIDALQHGRGCHPLEGASLVGVRFRMPTEEDPMCLMIVRASTPAGRFIAFQGAPSVAAALLAWRKKDSGKGLKWRVDVPWGER